MANFSPPMDYSSQQFRDNILAIVTETIKVKIWAEVEDLKRIPDNKPITLQTIPRRHTDSLQEWYEHACRDLLEVRAQEAHAAIDNMINELHHDAHDGSSLGMTLPISPALSTRLTAGTHHGFGMDARPQNAPVAEMEPFNSGMRSPTEMSTTDATDDDNARVSMTSVVDPRSPTLTAIAMSPKRRPAEFMTPVRTNKRARTAQKASKLDEALRKDAGKGERYFQTTISECSTKCHS
jgi:hypothetical protein